MSQELLEADQFVVKELFIQGKEGPVSIQYLFDELNLYDSLFLPVCSGNVIITDTLNLTDKLSFDGTDVISIHLVKAKNALPYRKNFRIYKQSNRVNVNQNTERYVLHFVAEEYFTSSQLLVNRGYTKTYSKLASLILSDILKTKQTINVEKSFGERKIVVPNLNPLQAVEWCAKRAIGINQIPDFVFYSDNTSMNFVRISTLLSQKEVLPQPIKFGSKNLTRETPETEMYMAKGIEILSQTDIVDKIQSGVFSSSLVGFDTSTGFVGVKQNTFDDVYSKSQHANKNPLSTNMTNVNGTSLLNSYDSNKSVYSRIDGRTKSNYIKENSPGSISFNESYEKIITQRKFILSNLASRKLKVAMPGNFSLTSGKMVNLDVAPFAVKSPNDTRKDESLNGRYIITATRHTLSLNKHTTTIEVMTDSTTDKRKLTGTSKQDALARKKTS
jgi:hypothetical protein